MTHVRASGPVCAALAVATLVACQLGGAENRNRTEKLSMALQKERTARRLAELEKQVLQLRHQVTTKNRQLAGIANLAKPGAKGRTKGVGAPAVPPKASDATGGCPKARKKPLKIEIKGYRGRKMEILVHNGDCRTHSFSPKGMYFVPVGARPQRMGATGPYEIYLSGMWQPVQHGARTFLAPGQRMRMRLQVYCLDRRRAEPSNGQSFRVARGRLPQPLQRRLDRAVNPYVRGRRRLTRPAKRRIQRRIWNVRDAFDSPLDGE